MEWEGDLYLAALVQRPSLHTTVAALLSDTLLHILSVLNDLSTKESIESDYFHNYPSLMDMKSWVMLYLLPDCCFCCFFPLACLQCMSEEIKWPYPDKIMAYFNIYMYRKYTFIVAEFFLAGINGAKVNIIKSIFPSFISVFDKLWNFVSVSIW